MKREKFDQIFNAADPARVDRALYRMAKQNANSLAFRWGRRGHVVDTDDLAQGIWLHVIRAKSHYSPKRGSPWAFFWAIGRRQGQEMLGRRRRKYPVEDAPGKPADGVSDSPPADVTARRSDALAAHNELETRLREDPAHSALISAMLDPTNYDRGRPPRPLWRKIARRLGKSRAEVLALITSLRFKTYDLVNDERKFPCRTPNAGGRPATSSSPDPVQPTVPPTRPAPPPPAGASTTNAATPSSKPSTGLARGGASRGPDSPGLFSANSAATDQVKTSTTSRRSRRPRGGAAA